ncbi:PLC-E protein [Mollisia scopiformis]|uniref:PLC-E protein n=1 Tax=Mollisia scopiformis TaxID=149040 RepID=A0A194XKV2_MOLSC|nr:PLC-E protein [Mollisia scopiformis]KUJ20808.1 PLC-E protein [Mollisia scopiformis]
MGYSASVAVTALCLGTAFAGSIKDIKHVVLFMQENRAFDHYFGTMPGVRGFADPNVQVNPDGKTTFQQLVTPALTNASDILQPWYINYLGGDWLEATQCIGAGSNSWQAMHAAYNDGLTNQWAATNTPYSIGYFKRSDIPTHFDIAEGWTVGDMYQEGILAATDPNRIIWMSGTVNNPGTPNNPNGDGGMILDNSATPGCEKPHLNCYPFTWKTIPEYWQDAGVSWQVYQPVDNFEDNMLAYFQQYQAASNSSPLTTKGNSYLGLDKFYADAAAGTLPQVSYIVGPPELSEHYPYLPSDGAWLQKKVVDAVTSSPLYKETVLMISYDEVGGYGDHVTPFHAPKDTPGEWINDPYGEAGDTPVGPGFRLPFYIISPWTRGGHVFTEHADHNSQIMFLEQWLEALGYDNVQSKELPPWRRQHMSNLVNAFDFNNPKYSIPHIHSTIAPLTDPSESVPSDGIIGALSGDYIGAAKCQADYPTAQPPVPSLVDNGFKQVRGSLTEGRYLTFEINGYALTNTGKIAPINQRWVLHQVGDLYSGNTFQITSAVDGRYISYLQGLTSEEALAETFAITDFGNGQGYTMKPGGTLALNIEGNGAVATTLEQAAFQIFSVTYHS